MRGWRGGVWLRGGWAGRDRRVGSGRDGGLGGFGLE